MYISTKKYEKFFRQLVLVFIRQLPIAIIEAKKSINFETYSSISIADSKLQGARLNSKNVKEILIFENRSLLSVPSLFAYLPRKSPSHRKILLFVGSWFWGGRSIVSAYFALWRSVHQTCLQSWRQIRAITRVAGELRFRLYIGGVVKSRHFVIDINMFYI